MGRAELAVCDLVLKRHFGSVARDIAMVLARVGPLTFAALLGRLRQRFAEDSISVQPHRVKEVLFVLIHHNAVLVQCSDDASLSALTAGINARPIYRLDVDAVIRRLGYAQLMVHSSSCIAELELLQNVASLGRISMDPTVKLMKELLNRGLLFVVDSLSGTCAASNSLDMQPALKKSRVDEQMGSFVTLNLRTLATCLWKEQLVSFVSRCINAHAGLVMRCILEGDELPSSTVPVTRSLLLQKDRSLGTNLPVIRLRDAQGNCSSSLFRDGSAQADQDALDEYLERMALEVPFFKHQSGESSSTSSRQGMNSYVLDCQMAQDAVRMNIVQSLIESRFGLSALRLFRIILSRQMVEEKTISRLAMMAAKDVRCLLFSMMKAGFVHLQEVPRTADHAPSRTFYLWTVVDRPRLWRNVAELALHAIANAESRMQTERSERVGEVLLAKSERSDVIANPSLLSSMETQRLKMYESSLRRISMLQSDCMLEYLLLTMSMV